VFLITLDWTFYFFKFLKIKIWKRILKSPFVWVDRRLKISKKIFLSMIPTTLFIGKTLYLLTFSIRLHFLSKFFDTSYIQILKIGKWNKYANLLFYKILIYKILRLVSPYQEFAIENLKTKHFVFLVLKWSKNTLKSEEVEFSWKL